jgi:hypothetical protein
LQGEFGAVRRPLSGVRFPASGLRLPASEIENWILIVFEAETAKKES